LRLPEIENSLAVRILEIVGDADGLRPIGACAIGLYLLVF
jgi:hypothetical protein